METSSVNRPCWFTRVHKTTLFCETSPLVTPSVNLIFWKSGDLIGSGKANGDFVNAAETCPPETIIVKINVTARIVETTDLITTCLFFKYTVLNKSAN